MIVRCGLSALSSYEDHLPGWIPAYIVEDAPSFLCIYIYIHTYHVSQHSPPSKCILKYIRKYIDIYTYREGDVYIYTYVYTCTYIYIYTYIHMPLRVVKSSHSPRAVCILSQIGTCFSASCWLEVVDCLWLLHALRHPTNTKGSLSPHPEPILVPARPSRLLGLLPGQQVVGALILHVLSAPVPGSPSATDLHRDLAFRRAVCSPVGACLSASCWLDDGMKIQN